LSATGLGVLNYVVPSARNIKMPIKGLYIILEKLYNIAKKMYNDYDFSGILLFMG
jgi:hypothetical protein